MKRISLLLLFCVLSINFVYAQSKALTKQLKEFDAYVDNARKQWDAVGMAIAVVKDNEVIFKKAYGVKELNTNNAVDNNTLFACASTTKLMTATS
ncbi:MAG: serine hydrolase domain-containing protein, partial [Cyclobacteriaceae bacterium]